MDDRGGRVSRETDPFALARAVCDRNFGIGADGLILVGLSDEADLAMRIINEDGSEAEMCGNGVRCFARYVIDEGITSSQRLEISTGAGIVRTEIIEGGRVRVDMGEPAFAGEDLAAEDGERVVEAGRELTFVSMGNPHAVTFVDGYDFDWRAEGARIENAASFPNRTNVEYIRVLSDAEVEMKVWERGCGETMACGTGACASVVAGRRRGHLGEKPVTVHLPRRRPGSTLDRPEPRADDRPRRQGLRRNLPLRPGGLKPAARRLHRAT